MKRPLFVPQLMKADDGLGAETTLFRCPKCGHHDCSVHLDQSLDRLICMCPRCGYSATREPLDSEVVDEPEAL